MSGRCFCRIASCLGTKRGLCDRTVQCLGFSCYNERDAARVFADLKLLLLLRCDLQKSVFDGWMSEIWGVGEDGVRLRMYGLWRRVGCQGTFAYEGCTLVGCEWTCRIGAGLL